MNKSKVIFLSVPESLAEDIKNHSNGGMNFTVDPSVPLPVEIENDAVNPANLAETLTWEMIISGMIRVITSEFYADTESGIPSQIKPGWTDYYRHFVITIKPEIYNKFTGAAIIKARNRDFDSAMEIISALEALFPFSPETLLNKALIQEEEAADLEKKGCEMEASLEYDRALETYLKALDMEPVLPEIYFNLGFYYMRRKDFDRAAGYFGEYVPLADDPEKREKAESIINEIKSQGLDDVRYTESLDLIRRGKEDEALLLIKNFLEEHPTVWNAWFILGWALRKQKRWNDALQSFKKAIDLGGGSCDTRNETAICLMELGDYDSARKELEAALHTEPENVKIISNLGMLALKKGDSREASAFFRTVLELNPNDPLALKYI